MHHRITAVCTVEQFQDLLSKFKLLNPVAVHTLKEDNVFVLRMSESRFSIHGYKTYSTCDLIISYQEMVAIFEMAYVVGLEITLNAHFPPKESDPIL